MATLKFGSCRNCGHQIVLDGSAWMHHVSRSRLYGVPHWPAGHVITKECRHKGCGCALPELDQAGPTEEKLVYLGKDATQ